MATLFCGVAITPFSPALWRVKMHINHPEQSFISSVLEPGGRVTLLNDLNWGWLWVVRVPLWLGSSQLIHIFSCRNILTTPKIPPACQGLVLEGFTSSTRHQSKAPAASFHWPHTPRNPPEWSFCFFLPVFSGLQLMQLTYWCAWWKAL